MNYKEIMELTEWLEKSSFTSYSLSINGVHISVSKQNAVQNPDIGHTSETVPVPHTQDIIASEPQAQLAASHIISSPIVGIYYESASPETPAFVQVGQHVKKGDTLCILEAMKVMNEITADVDGVVTEIFVSNGDMVEACMSLFEIAVS